MSKIIGYKRAKNYIIKLEIPIKKNTNNLDRPDVRNKLCAKMRAKEARVLSIQHIVTGHSKSRIPSDWDKTFIYKLGETVTVPDYDPDPEAVCTSGIHFFLSKEAAICYGGVRPKYFTGIWKNFY